MTMPEGHLKYFKVFLYSFQYKVCDIKLLFQFRLLFKRSISYTQVNIHHSGEFFISIMRIKIKHAAN